MGNVHRKGFLVETQISHKEAANTGKQRVIISISIPDLNESFSFCSTSNESTRLLLSYIKCKLKVHFCYQMLDG